MYGMVKTTIYLPESLKERVSRVAHEQNRSEAEVIRAALEEFTSKARPRPTLPLFESVGRPDLAERVDEILEEGFGRD
jgi:Arc/MetJ-type ribon-helix-helix transcriptional regulator